MNDAGVCEWLASLRRLRVLAAQTMAEALRLRLAGLLAAATLALLFSARWLRDFNFGAAEIAFIGDFGRGVIGMGGILLAALAAAHLFFSDLPAAATFVLTRRTRRWEYVFGKLAGVSGMLALFTAVMGGALGALMAWRAQQLGAVPAALPVFLSACALQWMKFTLVAAMTLVVCAYASSALFAGCAGLMLALVGHLQPFATGRLEWLRIWPNLSLFDAVGSLEAASARASAFPLALMVYWIGAVTLAGLIAAWAFRLREF